MIFGKIKLERPAGFKNDRAGEAQNNSTRLQPLWIHSDAAFPHKIVRQTRTWSSGMVAGTCLNAAPKHKGITEPNKADGTFL